MIGLSILVVIVLYWWLAKTVVNKVYANTQSLTKKRIAITIFILIPTWDVILGFPIYAYLCITKAGVYIYKTVDNVEGFYIGEQSNDVSVANNLLDVYNKYHFIDYKYKNNGKYYRAYWVDNNISANCIDYGKYKYSVYAEAFRHGRCVVSDEIKENEVSRWEIGQQVNDETIIIPNYITRWTARIIDNNSHKPLAELVNYYYGEGWVAIAFSSVAQYARWTHCSLQKSYNSMLLETLKPKKGEN